MNARGVLISGGTSGIGFSAAEEFLTHGERVVIGGRDKQRVTAAVADLARKHAGADVAGVQLDVRVAASVAAAVREAKQRLGAIQVLVNSAGIFPRMALLDLDDETWEDTFATNVTGAFRCTKAVVPQMADAGGGSIVNVGSIWAKHVWPNRSAYAASKAALEQFTRCAALELAPLRIRLNAVSPGIMRTNMTAGVLNSDAFVAGFMPRVTAGRVGEPDTDLAGVIRFLTLDQAAYMYGEIVGVMGGYY